MAKEKDVGSDTPAVPGSVKRYFRPIKNETVIIAVYADKDQKVLSKAHPVVLKKGVVYCADKEHEVKACQLAGCKECKKPVEAKIEDIE
jgi:hypothetical protein